MKNKTRQSLWAYLLISPSLVLFGIFLLLPILLAFVLAFKDFRILQITGAGDFIRFLFTDYVGWRNFFDAVRNPVLEIAIHNTLLYTLVMVPVSVVFSFLLASLMTPLSERVQGFFRGAYYLPGMMSAVVISVVWKWIYEPEKGLINLALNGLGVHGPDWLGDPGIALASVILSGAVYAPGFGVILYSAAISRVPAELHEAARIDGASPFQRWVHVVIPLLKPATLYLMVMNTIWSFQVFTNIYVMTRGGPGYSTTTMVYHIFDLAFAQSFRKGEAAAVALILFAMVVAFAVLQFRFIRGEAEH